MRRRNILLIGLALATLGCAGTNEPAAAPGGKNLLVIGASGRIGGHIVQEALARGHTVSGMTRRPESLAGRYPGMTVVAGDVLDATRMRSLVSDYDTVIVSVGGRPQSPDPEQYIAATAASSLIEVLAPLGDAGPRLLFVGSVFTLKRADGRTLLESHPTVHERENYPMFLAHQIALDRFRASSGVRWTVASPPNGLRLSGRTGDLVWGDDHLLLDDDGSLAQISPEDYAYALMEEIEHARYVGRRFTVARRDSSND